MTLKAKRHFALPITGNSATVPPGCKTRDGNIWLVSFRNRLHIPTDIGANAAVAGKLSVRYPKEVVGI